MACIPRASSDKVPINSGFAPADCSCLKKIAVIAIILIPLAAIVVGSMAAGGFTLFTNVFTVRGGIGLAVSGVVIAIGVVAVLVFVCRRSPTREAQDDWVNEQAQEDRVDDQRPRVDAISPFFTDVPVARPQRVTEYVDQSQDPVGSLSEAVQTYSAHTRQGHVFQISRRDATMWIVGGQDIYREPLVIPLVDASTIDLTGTALGNRYCFVRLEDGAIAFRYSLSHGSSIEVVICRGANRSLIRGYWHNTKLEEALMIWDDALVVGRINKNGYRIG
ncbi:MAG: hypothetical protein ACKVOH_04730 [Chlamydiales bacterium]